MDGVYCVTRRGLVDALRAGLPGDSVEHGRRCTSVVFDSPLLADTRRVERRVARIGFAAGPSLKVGDGDVVVGAEGARSALCAALNPGFSRRPSRVFEIVMSSRMPELAARLGQTFVKTVCPERGLAFGLLSPCTDEVIGFLQFDVRRHGIPCCPEGSGLLDYAAELLGEPPHLVRAFLRDVDGSTAHLWRPTDAAIAGTLSAGNAVVIGDAAHPLLPFCSQGVSAALEDAVKLADAIAGAGGCRDRVSRALLGFCDARRPELTGFVQGGRRILSHFLGATPEFVAPYVHPGPVPLFSPAVERPREDPLFADAAVDLATLRRRAYNHRWAVHRPGVIPLTAADSDFPVSEDIIDAVQRHLADGYVPYGPPDGLPELRAIAADTLRHRHGLPCSADTLFPTDGAASALFLATRLALPVAGDEAIIPDPVDFLLERSIRAAGGIVRRWSTIGGRYDADALEELITPRTRLISFCNPHNPIGRVLRRDELESIAEVALRHKLTILSDEVWSDIIYAPHAHVSIAALGDEVAARTFTVFGFSKSYGLAGMRLGLINSPNRVQQQRIMTLAHAHDTAYGASTISQVAGAAAYELGDAWLNRFVAHLRRRRDQAVTRLAAIPDVRCTLPQGTFVAFPDISGLQVDQDELAARLLERHDVAVVPGSSAYFGPGAAGHLRLSFATSQNILDEGLDRLEAGLNATRNHRELAATA